MEQTSPATLCCARLVPARVQAARAGRADALGPSCQPWCCFRCAQHPQNRSLPCLGPCQLLHIPRAAWPVPATACLLCKGKILLLTLLLSQPFMEWETVPKELECLSICFPSQEKPGCLLNGRELQENYFLHSFCLKTETKSLILIF